MTGQDDFNTLSKVLAGATFTAHVVVPVMVTVLLATQSRPVFPVPLRTLLAWLAIFVLLSGVVEVAWWLPGEAGSFQTKTLITEASSTICIGLLLVLPFLVRKLDEHHTSQASKPEANAWAQELFESSPIGLALVSLDGRWLKVNREVEIITGYSKAQLLGGMTFQDITHPDDLEEDLSGMHALVQGEHARYSMLKRYIRADKSVTWVRLTVSMFTSSPRTESYFISQIEPFDSYKAVQDTLTKQLDDALSQISSLTRQNETLEMNFGALVAGRIEHAVAAMRSVLARKDQD